MSSNGTGLELESSILIARPAEDIWKFLWEISNDTQWRSGTITAGWTSDPPYGVGSTGLHVVDGLGDFPWKATEVEEPHVMSWDTTGGRFEGGYGSYRIEPEDGGSRMTVLMGLKSSIFNKILLLFMRGNMSRQLTSDLEKLKAILEA